MRQLWKALGAASVLSLCMLATVPVSAQSNDQGRQFQTDDRHDNSGLGWIGLLGLVGLLGLRRTAPSTSERVTTAPARS